MAYAPTAITAHDIAISQASTRRRPGLLSRLFEVLVAARTRQAEREIAAFVRAGGNRFTDATEREIERRFLSHPNRF